MSLHQRVSANTSRRTSISHSVPFVTSDHEQRLLDSLNSAHTELNKTNSERDRYQNLLEQATKKLAETNLANTDLKSQVQTYKNSNTTLKDKVQHLKEENDRLNDENDALAREYAELKVKFSNLTHQYNALSAASPTFGATGPLPERPKLSRSSSKKERKEDREDRNRNRDKDKERERERERERDKDKDKEKEKEKEREKREQKAEKERLSRRFEERRAAPPAPPPISNRRGSFIEGWGPGGRSSSSGSSTRSYANGANGHVQVPASAHKGAYSNVPRTAASPLTPRIYNGSGNTTVFDDDGGYEDGNYHAYPISR